jgi:hypothetical protein
MRHRNRVRFGWTMSGGFKHKEDWLAYLRQYAARLNAPLQVSVAR